MNRTKYLRALSLFLIVVLFLCSCSLKKTDPLTQEERNWLDNMKDKITLAYDANYPPFTFTDEQGISSGIHVDYMKLLEKKLGFTFKIVQYDNWKELQDDARKRKIDVISTIMKNESRSSFLNFTVPYASQKNLIFVRKEFEGSLGLDEMNNIRTGFISGSAVETFLREKNPKLDLVPLLSIQKGLLSLSEGDVDAFIATTATASYWMEKEGIQNL